MINQTPNDEQEIAISLMKQSDYRLDPIYFKSSRYDLMPAIKYVLDLMGVPGVLTYSLDNNRFELKHEISESEVYFE